MTDNDIKKALEGMIQFANTVDRSVLDMVDVKTLKNILDLINRLEAENDRKDKIYIDLLKTSSARADMINELQAEKSNYLKKPNSCKPRMRRHIKKLTAYHKLFCITMA